MGYLCLLPCLLPLPLSPAHHASPPCPHLPAFYSTMPILSFFYYFLLWLHMPLPHTHTVSGHQLPGAQTQIPAYAPPHTFYLVDRHTIVVTSAAALAWQRNNGISRIS